MTPDDQSIRHALRLSREVTDWASQDVPFRIVRDIPGGWFGVVFDPAYPGVIVPEYVAEVSRMIDGATVRPFSEGLAIVGIPSESVATVASAFDAALRKPGAWT